MPRLIIASNRLPITAKRVYKTLSVHPSMGGLASGLDPLRRDCPSIWIGWPGDTSRWSAFSREGLSQTLDKEGCCPVFLTAKEVRGFYREFSNACLWPLYHSLPSLMPLEVRGWEQYEQVNRRFADGIIALYKDGDPIWIHDFQLSLVPQMVRQRLPHARIGFFLHIPFPPTEIFRILPRREEILRGMLGADVVGFHTSDYAQSFAKAVRQVLGLASTQHRIKVEGRPVRWGAFPLGVDVEAFAAPIAMDVKGSDPLRAIREANPGVKVLLAVDRLDYTKGIPHRLLAFERLLDQRSDLRGKVIFVQIAVPSRSGIVAYDHNKRSVEELVGNINGRLGAPGYQPIHYFSSTFNREDLIRLYRGVDVMVVTPLRDGMNLVAKEFCASRTDQAGVLILSEFAGAAAQMREALVVNPYNLDECAAAYGSALEMTAEEARRRMLALRAGLKERDHKVWAKEFLNTLEADPLPLSAVAYPGEYRQTPTINVRERTLADGFWHPVSEITPPRGGALVT